MPTKCLVDRSLSPTIGNVLQSFYINLKFNCSNLKLYMLIYLRRAEHGTAVANNNGGNEGQGYKGNEITAGYLGI